MILYRCMTQDEIDIASTKGVFEPTHGFSIKNGGIVKINNKKFFNTFNVSQNECLHFFNYCIDGASYFYNQMFWMNSLRLCKFDIPDEYLDKGYGFYEDYCRREFISKEKVPYECLVNLFSSYDNQKLLSEINLNLNEAIYWYSSAGKAMAICTNPRINSTTICNDIYNGGFLRVFNEYFNSLKVSPKSYVTNDFLDKCKKKNLDAYENSSILSDIPYIISTLNKYYNSGLTYEEINELFNSFEDLYINGLINSIEDITFKNTYVRKKDKK